MFTIAIDGPSGSGKSTAAKATAQRLGARYLDTGAMYRAVAVGAMAAGIGHDDASAIAEFCRRMDLEISTDPLNQFVRLAGRDVTQAIRAPEVSAWVSAVSTNAECRADLVARQRAIIATGNFVAEGRDITTEHASHKKIRKKVSV